MIQLYPCIWFNGMAKAAANYYTSIFPDSKIINITPFVAIFELNKNKFMALDGGPEYSLNESVSFVIQCETQEEIDYYWNKLTEQGHEGKCGWLKDQFGLSWQVVPSVLSTLMSDPITAPKAMYSFMQMKKFDLSKLLSDCNP